jgi:hypothetical protein
VLVSYSFLKSCTAGQKTAVLIAEAKKEKIKKEEKGGNTQVLSVFTCVNLEVFRLLLYF